MDITKMDGSVIFLRRVQVLAPLVFLCLPLFISTPAVALKYCQCSEEPELPYDALNGAFAVFTGEVIAIDRAFNPDRTRVKFRVEQSWKGTRHSTISVFTSGSDAIALLREGITCGYRFTVGERYLVYSFRKRNHSGLSYVSDCSRTRRLAEAEEDLALLGQPELDFTKKAIRNAVDGSGDHPLGQEAR